MSASFLDSNIFIYLFDEINTDKRQRATQLVQEALATDAAHLSFQVVQDVLDILTRELAVSPVNAQRFMDATLVPLWKVTPNRSLYGHALELQARYRFSFYGSLVVAAALTSGCTKLYSEDVRHGQRAEGLILENRFVLRVRPTSPSWSTTGSG